MPPLDFLGAFSSMAGGPQRRRDRPVTLNVSERNHISLVAYARPPLNEHVPHLIALSEGALTVRTDGLLSPADPVEVTIYFVEADREMQISAEVVWVNERLGDMALRFVELSPGSETLIDDYLEKRARKQQP